MKHLFTTLICFVLALPLFSQNDNKVDVILKLNGDEMKGKVLEMGEDVVKFSYAGETLVYSIKKTDILKITFSSGRTEVITKPGQAAPASNSAPVATEDHHNKIGILPFSFVRDGQPSNDQLGEKVQLECFSFLSKHAGTNIIVEPRSTNALLVKAGITKDNIKGYTMDDICNIMGVEYVVDGFVTVDRTTQTSYSSSSGSSKTKEDPKNDTQKDNRYSGSTYSTNTQNYKTVLVLNIYNDKGASVYSQERQAFFNTDDAYKNTLEYLLKRSPVYHK